MKGGTQEKMPKKIEPDEEYEEEEEDEEEEEEDEEEIEERLPRGRPKILKKMPRVFTSSRPTAKPQRRYAWVVQQQAEALVDTETNEVIATDIGTALADITERLERIEDAIGVMQEG